MKLLSKIRKEAKVVFILALAFTGIAFVQKRQSKKICQAIRIELINPDGGNFVDEEDIRRVITGDESVFLTGTPFQRIDLKEIENRARTNKYIRDAQAYKDHRGTMVVEVFTTRPIARILRSGQPDLYLSDQGNLFPVSEKYTSRVVLISGPFTGNLKDHFRKDVYLSELFNFISFLHEDPFWKAQIAQIEISKDGELKLYPQVTKQVIEFGRVDGWEKKLGKLKIFYHKILPYKGWNTYSRVNLVYENQIICE